MTAPTQLRPRRRRPLHAAAFALGLIGLFAAAPVAAQTTTASASPEEQGNKSDQAAPATPGSDMAAAQPRKSAEDPFARLRVVIPRDKLPPLRSVRVRVPEEAKARSHEGNITTSVSSSPRGAAVTYGGKLLGVTPFSMAAKKGSPPLDVVIRAKGYMTLRTRLRRKQSRSYFFKLTPAKIR